jgi:3-phytase/alkaline phosphatase D
MKLWYTLPFLLAALLDASGAQDATRFTLAGEFLIPAGTQFEKVGPSRFGAISGIATLPGGCELLGISDDDVDGRFYRFRVTDAKDGVRVTPLQRILLQPSADAPATLDPEGIALTRSGTVLISSEGLGGTGPRLPPAILEYEQDGRFVRQLPVPRRFVPNVTGPLTAGVRRNGGFESLTITPDFQHLFTANELPLVQDGPADAFETQRVRILEYAADKGGYRPAREFAYELTALDRPPFATGLAINGVSELLALDGRDLLVLERGFVQARSSRLGLNRIRLYRISLEGATDVSSIDSLAKREDVKPVRKTLVQDFSQLAGRSLRLLNLENFEGLAWVGKGPERSLLVVSDDNFNALQVTAFLLFDRTGASPRVPVCP